MEDRQFLYTINCVVPLPKNFMDKDTMEYIDQFIKQHSTPQQLEVAKILSDQTEELANLVNHVYKEDEAEGTQLMGMIIESIIIASSKNLDEAINRLERAYLNAKESMIELDKEANKVKP
jgi:hypothetical protein